MTISRAFHQRAVPRKPCSGCAVEFKVGDTYYMARPNVYCIRCARVILEPTTRTRKRSETVQWRPYIGRRVVRFPCSLCGDLSIWHTCRACACAIKAVLVKVAPYRLPVPRV